jgi:transketolase
MFVKKNYNKISKEIRRKIIELSYKAKSSHLGSSLSIVDILVVLYKDYLKKNIFILSKGHACLSLYVTLNKFGFITSKTLKTFGKNNSILMAHSSHKVSGIEFSTGSLGHGLPYAAGRALGEKINNSKKKIFVLISDGELNEGTTWETLLFASYHKLDNLIIIIDYNKIQSIDFTKNILKIEPLKLKLQSFGCNVKNIDGHNYYEISKSLLSKSNSRKPTAIIANTVKGKGVKFMENKIVWHYKPPNKIELTKALNFLK